MKRCGKCGVEKFESEFHKDKRRKDRLCPYCKQCSNEQHRNYYYSKREERLKYAAEYRKTHPEYTQWYKDKYYQDNRERMISYSSQHCKDRSAKTHIFIDSLKTPCVKCGETRLWIIQFHHINPTEKSFNLSNSHYGKDKIIEERKKCVCLCSNCHDEFHYFYGKSPVNPVEDLTDYLGRNPYEV